MTDYLVTMTVTVPVTASGPIAAFEMAKRDGLTAPWSASLVSVETYPETPSLAQLQALAKGYAGSL